MSSPGTAVTSSGEPPSRCAPTCTDAFSVQGGVRDASAPTAERVWGSSGAGCPGTEKVIGKVSSPVTCMSSTFRCCE